jgi:hypothetical protein
MMLSLSHEEHSPEQTTDPNLKNKKREGEEGTSVRP